MNEIKIRSWNESNNDMVYSDNKNNKNISGRYIFRTNEFGLLKCYLVPMLGYHISFYEDFPNDIEIKNIMLYIGKKDIKGKEIYEGDIIQYWSHNDKFNIQIAIIKYDESACCFVADTIHRFIDLNQFLEFPCEVIGNIYENSELLR